MVGRWPLAPCEEPSGLAIDREHRRLFTVCRNRLMAVVDGDSGRVLATVPTGAGTDGAAFDPAAGLAFASNGEGTLTVVREDSPEKFTLVGNVPTKRGARTIALDPATHRIYLPTAEFGPAPAATASARTRVRASCPAPSRCWFSNLDGDSPREMSAMARFRRTALRPIANRPVDERAGWGTCQPSPVHCRAGGRGRR